jgi:hypothetical protein
MAQLGHTDSRSTLNVHTHVMNRDPAERDRLKAFVSRTGWRERRRRGLSAAGLPGRCAALRPFRGGRFQ